MAYMGPPVLVADVVLWPDRSILKQSYDARERKMDATLPQHLVSNDVSALASMCLHACWLCSESFDRTTGIWQLEWRWIWHWLVQPASGVSAFRSFTMRVYFCHSCVVGHQTLHAGSLWLHWHGQGLFACHQSLLEAR